MSLIKRKNGMEHERRKRRRIVALVDTYGCKWDDVRNMSVEQAVHMINTCEATLEADLA